MITNPSFLLIQTLNSIALGMNLFIAAAGLSLIFGVLRVINFAHGAFFALGAYICWSVVDQTNCFWLAILTATAALAAIAAIIERLLLARLYGRDSLYQLLCTFALVLLLSDLQKLIWGTDQHSVAYPSSLDSAVNLGFALYPSYLLFLCGAGPVVAIAIWWILSRSSWGRIVRAARQDREMLATLGVNVPRVYTGVFVAGAGLAGLAGALAAPRIALTPGMDATVVIDCFIVVIIGGLDRLWGSFVGALILGFATMFGSVFFPQWEIALTYGLMLLVLILRPWGLFGTAES